MLNVDYWFIKIYHIFYSESTKEDTTSRSSTPSKDIAIKDTPRSRGSSVKPTVASTSSGNNKETPKSGNEDDTLKRKRQRLDTNASEGPEEKLSKPEITISIPKDLKSRLVDDWHAINSQQKLVELPCKTTVDDIVKQYVQYKKSKSNSKGISCEDISNGILVR